MKTAIPPLRSTRIRGISLLAPVPLRPRRGRFRTWLPGWITGSLLGIWSAVAIGIYLAGFWGGAAAYSLSSALALGALWRQRTPDA